MGQLIEVQLGEYRPVGAYDVNGIECHRNDIIILELDKGSEFGRVVSDASKGCAVKAKTAEGKVIRRSTDGDLKQIVNNRMKAKEAILLCERKIADEKLDMRVVTAEYSFDSSKIIFSFTSEGRVDFRGLVKDLAKAFRVRIELKQIGVRDKAKVVGGIGVCGRELCCSSHMKGFHPLSIKMAKEQGLPLNPSKISGVCGRVKCCMAYEFQVYKEFARNLPKMGQKITTPEGEKGRVVSVNILKQFITVDVGDGKVTKMTYAQSHAN